jgi:hypothetical protein
MPVLLAELMTTAVCDTQLVENFEAGIVYQQPLWLMAPLGRGRS